MNAPAGSDVILSAQALVKHFGGGRQLLSGRAPLIRAVDGVSFDVRRGETFAIVGESGCGKSTLARLILRLIEPTAGTVEFDGADITAIGEEDMRRLRREMQMIFQEPMTSLNPAFRIGDQIAEAVVRHHGGSQQAARERALDVLRRVRIPAAEKRIDAYPHQLSGGMRQRVMIAMALVNRPDLLIADEPTTALDVTIQAQILALIAELQREAGMAMILVTHDLGVVAEVADRVAVMYAGRFVETGPVDAIFSDPQHPYTRALFSAIPRLDMPEQALSAIAGRVPPLDAMPPGCRFASRCKYAKEICTRAMPPLKEVGPGHFVRCVL